MRRRRALGPRLPGQTSPTAPATPAGLEKIEHFVFIMQENSSFDPYFGTYPGAKGSLWGSPSLKPWGAGSPYHDSR